jgi:hypothetical protein
MANDHRIENKTLVDVKMTLQTDDLEDVELLEESCGMFDGDYTQCVKYEDHYGNEDAWHYESVYYSSVGAKPDKIRMHGKNKGDCMAKALMTAKKKMIPFLSKIKNIEYY